MTRIRLQRRPSALPPGPTFSSFLGGDGWTLTDAGVVVETPVGTDLWEPLPPATFDYSYVAHTGTVWQPLNAAEFQTALSSYQRGDLIVLQSIADGGSPYVGNFTLPARAGTQPLNIMSSSHYNGGAIGLGATASRGRNRRVVPGSYPYAGADAQLFAVVRTPNTSPALNLALSAGASYYHLLWLQFDCVKYPTYTNTTQGGVVILEVDNAATLPSDLPRSIVFDHCLIDGHVGHPTFRDSKLGLRPHCREVALLDSYLDIGSGTSGQESHGVSGYKGPLTIVLDNNYIHAPGINILWGGAGSLVMINSAGAIHPQDITMTRNYLPKDMAYYEVAGVVVKNWYESKGSKRWLVEGNVCDVMWGNQGQSGHPVLMQNIIGGASNPYPDDQWLYQKILDTHMRYNKHLSGSGGPNVPATIDNSVGQFGKPEPVTRWKHEHNLYWGINSIRAGTGDIFNHFFSPTGPVKYCSFDQNTVAFTTGELNSDKNSFLLFSGAAAPDGTYGYPTGTRMRGSIFHFGQFGAVGDGTAGWSTTIAKYDPSFDLSKNVVHGNANPNSTWDAVRSVNQWVADQSAVLFVDAPNGDFHLQAGSVGKSYGLGGIDSGADIDTLDTETAHSIDGQWVTTPPLTLTVFTQPADAASGVAFGTQPVVLAAPGVVVTASIASGSGTLGGSLTATAGSDSLATFQRLYITGTGPHTLTFSATAPWNPATSSSFTVLSAPAPANVTVSEATEYQTWEGNYEVAQIGHYEASAAIYAADKGPVLDRIAELCGPLTIHLAWRIGAEDTVDHFVARGPWPGGSWGLMLDDLFSNWTPVSSGGTIFHTKQAYDMDEVIVPLRTRATALGKDLPRIQLLYHSNGNEPNGFRPGSTGGDGTGATYAARVLDLFQWMETTYGIVPDDVAIKNEPNIIGVWTNTDLGKAATATRALLAANGYFPRIVVPSFSTEDYISLNSAVTTMEAQGAVIDALSWHRYGGRTLANRQNIAALLATKGIPGLMTEWIVNAGTGQQSWEETIQDARASGWSLFILAFPNSPTGGGTWFSMIGDGNPQTTTYSRYIPQYNMFLRRNAQRIGCSESLGNLASANCFVNPDGKHVVVLRATAAITSCTVGGIPPGIYDCTETTTTAERVSRGAVTVNPGGVATLSGTNQIQATGGIGVYTMVRR